MSLSKRIEAAGARAHNVHPLVLELLDDLDKRLRKLEGDNEEEEPEPEQEAPAPPKEQAGADASAGDEHHEA